VKKSLIVAGACGAALLGGIAAAQTFRTGVDLVILPVIVTDSGGQFVGDLARDDFSVYEDDRPRPIEQFSAERVPVSLGILLDVSGSMEGVRFADAGQALARLLERCRQDDRIFLAVFNEAFRLLVPWTSDHAALVQGLSGVRPRGGTFLYSAVLAALPLLDQGANQKKALVIISDGDDDEEPAGPNTGRLKQAVQQSQASDAVVYALGIGRPRPPLGQLLDANQARQLLYEPPVDVDLLRQLTDPTGGYAQLVSSSADLSSTVIRIADDLSAQYVIGFESAQPADGRTHTVKVRVRNPDLRIRTRSEYVAMPRTP
jgi:Ca-activated chloride channel family protein